ncbi:MAG TPA: cell division protein FtsZ [Rubrivivax sp.]|nr:cell division protein FtsZ [Rubrivivax sp.]
MDLTKLVEVAQLRDLTLGHALALLAAVVLVALALHGWWSTRRLQPAKPRTVDPVQPAERVEPALDAGTLPVAQPAALRAGIKRSPPLDPLIDAIVPLALEAPIAAELALQHLPPTRRAGSKPFYVEGLDADTAQWEPIEQARPGQRYSELQAGVQMASRSGALNEIEYSEFMQKIEAFSDAVGATVKWSDAPDMLEVVARARELDSLASPLDAQLSITLRTNGVAWSVAYLQQVAARRGFIPGPVPGRLVLPSAEEGEPPMLVLAVDSQAALAEADQGPQHGAVRECTLSLDVPQTPAVSEPFPAWHRAATDLAEDLDATAIDDNGQPITLHAYASIGGELEILYRKLEQLDLAAGSPVARRLFS